MCFLVWFSSPRRSTIWNLRRVWMWFWMRRCRRWSSCGRRARPALLASPVMRCKSCCKSCVFPHLFSFRNTWGLRKADLWTVCLPTSKQMIIEASLPCMQAAAAQVCRRAEEKTPTASDDFSLAMLSARTCWIMFHHHVPSSAFRRSPPPRIFL